jgi:glycosyltransferase involved in cell wall biosynthesis
MKILIPSLHYPPVIGGFEIFTQSVSEEIGKTDDIFVVTGRVVNTPRKEDKNRLRIIRTSPQELKDLSYSGSKYILGTMIWIFFRSMRIIRKEKIELIHAQGFLSGILSYILSKLTRVPYIVTIQSADFSVYHHKLNIKPIVRFYEKMEKAIFVNAKYCHAISKHLENHLLKYGPKNTIVIPNGVDTKKFVPDPDKFSTRKKLGFDTENLIVCVSRLEHKNGTHDLIEAAHILDEELKNDKRHNFKIIVLGSGSQKDKLQEMIGKYRLKEKIFLLGSILYSEVPKYVAAGDIFIRPSLAEGFGNVFVEAMSAGVAVIGTPVGGIPDFLRDNVNGLFCEPGNPKDIAEKIKKLMNDEELAQKVITNGIKTAREEYDWVGIVKRVRDLYLKLITSSK